MKEICDFLLYQGNYSKTHKAHLLKVLAKDLQIVNKRIVRKSMKNALEPNIKNVIFNSGCLLLTVSNRSRGFLKTKGKAVAPQLNCSRSRSRGNKI